MSYPILEFDSDPEAHIEPSRVIRPADVAEACVICFFREVLERVTEEQQAVQRAQIRSEMGVLPVYELLINGQRLTTIQGGVGGPLAVGILEELIALGCRKFIACGGAGVLDSSIAPGAVIIPTSAVRDEGTSYHYLPPGREVAPHPAGVQAIESTLAAHDVPYQMAKTWTTDAIYRETKGRIARRRAEGCATVEMEAASFFAVAQFRGVIFAQLLYGGDDVGGAEWDPRDWVHGRANSREKLFWLAVESALRL